MLSYKYINKNYQTRTSFGIVKFGDEIKVDEKERKTYDESLDFELINGNEQIVDEAYLKRLMGEMGWRSFQRHAKKTWEVSDTNKDELIEEILAKIGGK